MSFLRALHLSDIHIGDTYMDSKDIAYRIISDIENENIKNINCVLVTGDIFEGNCGSNEQLIGEAVQFFNIIFEELKKTTDIKKDDFLFVPGNHDMIRVEDSSKRWKKYSEFLCKFYGALPEFYSSNDFVFMKTYKDYRVVFAGFNSCGLKKEPIFDSKVVKKIDNIDNSRFDEFSLSKGEILKFIEKQAKDQVFVDFGEIPTQQTLTLNRALKEYDDYNIIALFHHHFYLFPEIHSQYGDSSLIRNYSDVIQRMQQIGVKTVLHGHKHFDLERPLITESYYENANQIINVIAGGSVGTKRVLRHTFNVVDFFDKSNNFKVVQRKFIYNNDRLEPITVKHFPPEAKELNSSIKLFNTFNFNNPELYSKYINAIEKINIVADDYNNMIKWLENIFVGFNEVHKIFDNDPICIFFLLFAMNYRILKMKQYLGKENIDSSYFDILNELFGNVPVVDLNKDEYLKIFEQSELAMLKENCDSVMGLLNNKSSKFYLSFSMIGIFITDMYLMLRYYAGSFYNRYIKYKVNIKLDENEFHQNVPVQKIMIHSDADRRSAFIDLRCNTPTAHKMAVLFVKEFELIISKFEDYFKNVGLKLYYITPKIEKNDTSTAIDNYNFEAYIPTLIPLLTGDNIYHKKEVFARELIQNSIDAIAVRANSGQKFDDKIYITLGEIEGRKYFKIKDFGTGMDRFKIERYFTSIGRSFYSGDEYRELELNYNPISNFGIGFLSAFMVCREIDVKTRYFQDDSEGIKLHIPNYDGCFFIEKEENLDIGTEITLYLDDKISNGLQPKAIISYICETMRDISYDIVIQNNINNKKMSLKSRNIRRKINNKGVLFIPFSDPEKVDETINLVDDVWTNNYIDKYPYGLIVNLCDLENNEGLVLNSGIKLNDTRINDIWEIGMKKEIQEYRLVENFFIFNFPSNFISIDVSREKIANFVGSFVKNEFIGNVLHAIYDQFMQYIALSKETETSVQAINIHLFLSTLLYLCEQVALTDLVENLRPNLLQLYVRYNEDSLELIVHRRCNKPEGAIACLHKDNKKNNSVFAQFLSKAHDKDFSETIVSKDYIIRKHTRYLHGFISKAFVFAEEYLDEDYYGNSRIYNSRYLEINSYLSKLGMDDNKMQIAFWYLIAIALYNENEKERYKNKSYNGVMEFILINLLKNHTLHEIENNKCCIELKYEEIKSIIKRLDGSEEK